MATKKSATKKTVKKKPTSFVLRTCAADMTSHSGFVWPAVGEQRNGEVSNMSNVNTKHIGDLVIVAKAQAQKFAHIEEVTGSLYISADAQLPVLTSVGGYLDISADAQLPVLTSVGGSLYISADAQLPVLTSVGGYLDISADAQLPVLTSVGGYPATLPPITLQNTWLISILDQHMLIGCQHHSLHDWEHFDDRQIAEMDGRNAVRWWHENKADLLKRARDAGRSFEPVESAE